jgi:hypothetical protein
MNIDAILKQLETYEKGQFPRDALQAAIDQQEQITPALLDALQPAEDTARRLIEQHDYMLPIYAMFLLAQFREQRAYPLIADLFAVEDDELEPTMGDFVTEDLGRILASVSHGDMSRMQQLVENPNLDEYIRSAALTGMMTLVASGLRTREEILTYFQSLFRGGLEREFSHVWNALVSNSSTLYPDMVYEDIKQAYADDLVEPFFIKLENVKDDLEVGKEEILRRHVYNNRHYTLISDTIEEMQGWAAFQRERKRTAPSPPPSLNKQQTVVNTQKVGRNDPCPCGSGKKYKHCCRKLEHR